MMIVNVKADIEKALKFLDGMRADQVPYATKEALNTAAEAAKGALIAEMDRAFDRPTPYTKNSLYIAYATKQKLAAQVKIKDQASQGVAPTNYLFPEVEGGPRKRKGFENLLSRAGLLPAGWFAIPTDAAPFDAYGNVPGPTMLAILRQLQASSNSSKNETAGQRTKRNRTKDSGRYFCLTPADIARRHKGTPGIYERLSGGAAVPIFIFTAKQPKYKDRYHFYQVGQRAAEAAFPRAIILAIEKAIATAR